MIRPGSKVYIKDRDLEGRVVITVSALGGYDLYEVQFQKEEADKKLDDRFIAKLHEAEIDLISEDEAVDSPDIPDHLALGSKVMVDLGDTKIGGVVTAHHFSVSGCAECEVTYYTNLGVKRQVFEIPLLSAMPDAEPVEPGDQKGSFGREISSRY